MFSFLGSSPVRRRLQFFEFSPTLKSQRAHGFHPWVYITGTELKMHQNAVFRICNFKIFPGMTPPRSLVEGAATPSRNQHGAGLRRRCCDPHVTLVLGTYILRASSVSETIRRPWYRLCASLVFIILGPPQLGRTLAFMTHGYVRISDLIARCRHNPRTALQNKSDAEIEIFPL